jgi:glycerol kinase
MSARGPFVLAIDQGTTGTTVLVIDPAGWQVAGHGYREIPQSFPQPGWVEHDPESIWQSVCAAAAQALDEAGGVTAAALAGIGITNQRETTVLWERATGRPVGPAIVWQDRRTAPACQALKDAGREAEVRRRTGLVLDPYFSGTKIGWMLDHHDGLRVRAEAGHIAFGTIDSFLLWKLSGGAVHLTDASNASRTLLYDLHARAFSSELAAWLGVPMAMLPALCPSSGVVAHTRGAAPFPDGLPIAGVAGDQQAALYGQGCVRPGDAKCTYGTGAFLLMNVGTTPVVSGSGLLSTVAWTIDGETVFALEGSAFIAGALVQWLRDGLGIIERASEVEALAASVPDAGGVTIVPALTGLGAPHWRPEARGVMVGLSRGTTRAHLARAALEAIALQNVDLMLAMERDAGRRIRQLRVDGGAAANDLLLQLQADFMGIPIVRPDMLESTALGAAKLAARGLGLAPAPAPDAAEGGGAEEARTGAAGAGVGAGARAGVGAGAGAAAEARGRVFTPRMGADERAAHLDRWRRAVAKA